MKKILMTGLFFLVSNLLKRANPYREAAVDLTKLKVAMGYVQAIKVFRLLAVSLLGSGICLVFLFTGLVLFHCAILFYAPWDVTTKMWVTLFCGAAYILASIGIFTYVFAEDQWLKIFNADKVIGELTNIPDQQGQSRQTNAPENSAL